MNSKNSILLVDPGYDSRIAGNCTLLLKVTPDSFTYTILDTGSAKPVVIYDEQNCEDPGGSLTARIKEDPLLNRSFTSVKASVFTRDLILVPDQLYSSESLTDYTRFFPEKNGADVRVREVPSFTLQSVFSLNPDLENNILKAFTECSFLDHAGPALAMSKDLDGHVLLLDFSSRSFNAVYVAEGKLVFHRAFCFEGRDEFNYYLLYLIHQLGLEKSTIRVYVSGMINDADDLHQCIGKYFSDIHFLAVSGVDTENSILEDMPIHYYTSHLALNTCA